FQGIAPSNKDDLLLADGLRYRVLISEGERIKGDKKFGANNDYLAFFPLSSNQAVLWVNNEYPRAKFGEVQKRSLKNIKRERHQVGGSLLHIRRQAPGASWELVKNSRYNRRLDASSRIPLIAERPIEGSLMAEGTLANCAGGVTPWKTVLSCEENYQDYYGERIWGSRQIKSSLHHWEKYYPNPPEHYGWVVEVEPLTGMAKKLTALGRFAHESATCVPTKGGKVAVYSGDDKAGEFLYKFISRESDSLEKGELFVADMVRGRWLSLDRRKQIVLQKNFKDQLDVLIHCRKAARLLEATPLDRPEDVEINPANGDVFVCLTNNSKRGNHHGSILKITEKGGDHGAMEFKAQDFAVGGVDFSCPDNLTFDPQGNLWMATDISGKSMHQAPYKKFKNNGLFYIPLAGPQAGKVVQVASAPRDAELTGPCFSADGKSLFLCVQHPGERSKNRQRPTSHWPGGGTDLPKSSVVEITGEALTSLVT
ncbi:MAG: DUF839 domain-containing protein, partial [Acidimicrobiaceae bacterium]|nr:DUF839 domain-containing protein [Acidimicrobiaceae bacterium]